MKIYTQIKRCIKEMKAYRLSTYSAGASFFIITSILPLIMVILSVFSWIKIDIDVGLIEGISKLFPQALKSIFNFLIQNLKDIGVAEISISVIALLWTASRGMIGLIDGLNNIAGNEDDRNFIFKRLICLLYTLIFMVGLFVTLGLSVFGNYILSFLQSYFPYIGKGFSVIMEFRGLILYFLLIFAIAAMYAFFPNKKMNLLKQLPGAAIAAGAWLVFSALYSLYVQYVSLSSALYGGIGIVILAMVWFYCCIYIIFIGAAINKIYPDIAIQLWGKIKKLYKKIRRK